MVIARTLTNHTSGVGVDQIYLRVEPISQRIRPLNLKHVMNAGSDKFTAYFPNVAVNSRAGKNCEFGLWIILVHDDKSNRGGVRRVQPKSSPAVVQRNAERSRLH